MNSLIVTFKLQYDTSYDREVKESLLSLVRIEGESQQKMNNEG